MVLLTEILPEDSPFKYSPSEYSPSPFSSAPLNSRTYVYDIFISFRGVDTRNGFTDHLYNALLDAGFNTFLDDDDIETGDLLKPELESAIKSSRASFIILSKNYASSTWCLDELVLILEQKRSFNQIVIPIFYHVEPTDVRKQQNSFGEAMEKHKQRMEAEANTEKRSELAQKMESWKKALTQVADLKGKDAKDMKERELIKEIVADIHRRLGASLSYTMHPLIGRDYEVHTISSWLTDRSRHSADILTIVGMGGIGKTSLARYVYSLHSYKFEKCSFIEGINTKANERFDGLLDLQKQLHADIAKKLELRVNGVVEYTSMIENVLARKRVFIVLDDIGCLDQLDALLGNKGLHPGSKVIITTKDASLTKRCALIKSQVHSNNKEVLLNGLCIYDSLELLCVNAFNSKNPKEGYGEVSEKLVKYCEGNPLVIKVLGRSLQNKVVEDWEDCIKLQKKEPHSDIYTRLRVSFDALPYEHDKKLFKYIACFFVGIDRDVAETTLNACDMKTRSGITNLIDRCLLSIGRKNKLEMHSLIQDMGRFLVREESPEKPWKRSLLWCHEESFNVLKQKKDKSSILGLALDTRMLNKKRSRGSFELETESFSQMENLMLLQISYMQLNGCFDNFPKELRWLCMHGSPLKSLPLDLPMNNLVALDMSYSLIKSFDMSCSYSQRLVSTLKWLIGSSSKAKPVLGSLKILDLSFCEQLHCVGGFLELPALERLILTNCTGLTEVCESVEQCDELLHVDLSYCQNLRKLPIIISKLKKVETLLLDGCYSCESQIEMGNVMAIPSDMKLISFSLPSSLVELSLKNNNLSNNSFPMDFSSLCMLRELCLDRNPIVSMPNCVRTLPRLQSLSMNDCSILTLIENPPRTLRVLSYFNELVCKKFRKLKFDPEMPPLRLVGDVWYDIIGMPVELDGMLILQDMESVDEKVLHSLSWIDLDHKKRWSWASWRYNHQYNHQSSQMGYQFGIFSTFYLGEEIPDWISYRSKGSSVSFTIPSSPKAKKLIGLNFCCVEVTDSSYHIMPMIKIRNTTKNHTWIYVYFQADMLELGGKCVNYLSHWMFGPNEMETGDHITITVAQRDYVEQDTEECGIGLVYEENEDEKNEEAEKEDVLGYYKSWNHIIGGDLSGFQLTTGEYVLDLYRFSRGSRKTYGVYEPFVCRDAKFKEKELWFKAFSQKKGKEVV